MTTQLHVIIPADAVRQGMATYRRGGETVRVQHFTHEGRDFVAWGDYPAEAPASALLRLWAINDELTAAAWRCTSSSIIGLGDGPQENYFKS